VICADDKYACRTALSAAVKLWSADRNCDGVYGETIVIDENGREQDRQPPQSGPIWLFRYCPVVYHCSLLVRRRAIVDAGILLDVNFPYRADYVWIIRLIRAGCRFKRLRRPIAMFRQHSMQRSNNRDPARIEELRRVNQLYGELNPVFVYVVDKWWRLIKLKNLFCRRGFLVCVHAISERLSHDRTVT